MKNFKKIFLSFSIKEKKIFFSALAVGVGAAAILASILVYGATREEPVAGGKFREGNLGQPAFVNPVTAITRVDKSLASLLFAPLGDISFKIEPDGEYELWTVRLEEGWLWSDGEKITSDDFIFTINTIQDKNTDSPLFWDWQGVGTTRLSELEFQLKLSSPDGSFYDKLRRLRAIPEHIFGSVPPSNWRLSDYNLKPVGNGSYKFDNLNKNTKGFINEYSLKINSAYKGEPPLIEKISFIFFKDKDALVSAFNRGQIDAVEGLIVDDLDNIKRTHQVFSFEVPRYTAVFFNQSQNEILAEPAVREALAILAPKKQIVDEIFNGYALVRKNPIENEGAHTTTITERQAIEALEEAGWELPSLEEILDDNWIAGVRQKKVGANKINLEITLSVPPSPILIRVAETLKMAWERGGFKINIEKLSEEASPEIIKNREYEMIISEHNLGANRDMLSLWHSSARFFPGLNLAIYRNSRVDDLIEEANEAPLPTIREEKLRLAGEDIRESNPAVFLFSSKYIYVANNNLKGVRDALISEAAYRFEGVTRWYLKTAKVFK